jgi:hypothetical protein
MKTLKQTAIWVILFVLATFPQQVQAQDTERIIEFPDIPGYVTLKCDLHMHTVFSDGSVWPNIRVQEAMKDGLDAISITDHLEYQPKSGDIPHVDRNRSYQLAKESAEGTGLIVINGAEITRSMPPGHSNAIFVEDANLLNQEDFMAVFQEARRQGAFVFWNHPHWTSQQKNGVANLQAMHEELIAQGLLHGVEIYNDDTHSDEAWQIAMDNNLTILGNSDVHGLIDWKYDVPEGGHRPVTLVFATEKSEESMKEAMFNGQTAIWFDNTLVGKGEFLTPLIEASLKVSRLGNSSVQTLVIENISDADYILENLSEYSLHDNASVFILKAHEASRIQVKTIESLDSFQLKFRVLNAFDTPGTHPEISVSIH